MINSTFKEKLAKGIIRVLAFFGAAGVGLQNYMAVTALLQGISNGAIAMTKVGLGIMHSIAIAFGGICGGLVNLFLNIELLESFWERITKKNKPADAAPVVLSGWQKFSYWFGSGLFVITGVLYGLTAFAFGPVGVLAALGIASGILVAGIMTIQELETWLQGFDKMDEKKNLTLKQRWLEWKNAVTKGKVVGSVIAIGNVVALSLLMTLGMATFLMGVGVAALPALIVGLAVAFTIGAFTEYYFYNKFLSEFCDKIKARWTTFKEETKYPVMGAVCCSINALVNGALTYVGVTMIAALLASASIAVPPVGIIIAVAVTVAVFAAAASFILGLDFWTRNMKKPAIAAPANVKQDDETEKLLLSDTLVSNTMGVAPQQDDIITAVNAVPMQQTDYQEKAPKEMSMFAADKRVFETQSAIELGLVM
jgi:hypothetical protein